MNSTAPPSKLEQQLRDMNEALLVSSVRQQELAEKAEKADALVRKSEERYRTLFGLVPAAVYSCDTSGVIETFNHRAEELWGRAPARGDTDERFCGSFKLFRPDGSFMPHEQCPMAEVLSGKIAAARDAEVLIERPDGSRITVVVNIHPLKNHQGEVTGAVNCFYDITERKRAEETAESLNAQLQAAVRVRDRFLAVLSHELRNPLAALSNGLQLLKLAGKDPVAAENSQAIMERQLKQLVRLVDDLLDVSRIATGKLELRKDRVDLASVVRDAVEASRPLIDRGGHELTVTLLPDPVLLDVDPIRLAQVFLNLLNNAAKYSEWGGHIRLSVERDGSEVVVSVRDTGIGIAAAHLPHVFEVFVQVDAEWQRAQGGLGIGLSLVKEFVGLHGGSVSAYSDGPEKGSEFVVRLPGTVETTAAKPPIAAADRSRGRRRRILVVDDNRDAAEPLAKLLGIMGHDVRTAHDGEAAVVAVAAYRPEVILMDLGMPKVDGYEAARRIRAEPWGGEPFLVALTGWGSDADRRRTDDAGFDRHLVKPVDLDALTRMIAEMPIESP